MTKVTRLCNMCGKEIDEYCDFNISYRFGYGSIRDGDNIDIDLCNSCLDTFVTNLRNEFKIDPLIENSF